jgi:hypothetical protein
MPNVTITQLPAAGPITGSELVPVVQNGQTLRTTAAALAGSPVQTQTFLTLNQEPTLINSRYLQGGTGIGLVDAGALSYLQVVLNGASGSLEAAANGIIVKTGSSTVTNRSIAVTGDGLSITNGNGVSGNPTIGLTGLALAIAQVSGTGMLAVVGGSVIAGRQLYGTANQIDVAFGDGSNSPVFSLASNPILPGTGAVTLPKGTTAQRPTGQDGMIRYNTDTNSLETYDSGSWSNLPSGAVTLINTGTGLTGGPITSSGTISIAPTGIAASTYGSAAIVPVLTVNAQGQITGAIDTPISIDANQITVGLLAVDRGGTGIGGYANGDLIYASGPTTLSSLAIGTSSQVLISAGAAPQWADASTIAVSTFDAGTTGLTPATPTAGAVSLAGVLVGENGGTGVNNSGKTITLGGNLTTSGAFALTLTQTNTTNVTLPTTGTLATLGGSETLTNKTISGALNTLTNIPNAALDNSSVTIGSTSVSLGASTLTLAGLTSVAVTQGPLTALQLATKQYVDDAVSAGITIHPPVRVETPTALNATYTPGGTAVTVTDITGNKTLTFSTSPSLSINDQIVFSSTSNGITAGTAYYVYSVPAANQVTLSLSYSGPELTTLTDGTGLTIAGLVNAGVGATLTNAGTKAAIQIDGVTLSATNRVLVYNQVNAYENGVYTVTTVGTPDPGGTDWVLTRATTEDKYKPDSTTGLGQGDYFFVQEGSTGAGESYVLTTNNPIIIGTTNLTFTQFSASQVYSAGTGLTLSGTQFSLTSPVTAALGGTGLTSYTAGDLIYATAATTLSKLAVGSSTYLLTSSGTAPQWTDPSTVLVGSATNATNTGITASSANADYYLTVVSANTGNLPQLVATGLTANPSTGKITGGIAGGTF